MHNASHQIFATILANVTLLILASTVFGQSNAPALTATKPTLESFDAARFVMIQRGDLPILLSAPHGGAMAISNVPARKGLGKKSFKTKPDTNTFALTQKVSEAITRMTGNKPFAVMARVHRRFLDVNRRPTDAYESEKARLVYDLYHQSLSGMKTEIARRWDFGILIDLHGQSAKPNTIIRGTQNGQTTRHLITRFGQPALSGPASLLGHLDQQGFNVLPEVGTNNPEKEYTGGYIVIQHGSKSGGSLDAIQLEIGRNLRTNQSIDRTANRIAKAIVNYSKAHLPSGKERSVPAVAPSKIRVGVYFDKGTGPSKNSLVSVLKKFDNLVSRRLTAEDIRGGALKKLDVVIMPGGSGSGQARQLGESGRENIRKFVEKGGGYLGICAGAYLASADYQWSLHILDAKVLDKKHWARGKGPVTVSLTKMGQRVFHREQSEMEMLYAQGPILAPANNDSIADYQSLAKFKTEIAKNGAPTGVMQGNTAIAVGEYGDGKVICFSTHPELTDGLDRLVGYAITRIHADSQK